MIKSLHTENFRVLSGVRDYEFPEGIIGIVGPNGQGKSTLINAIAWALYGQEALPLRARDPVTWGEKKALVRVHLSLNDGQEWIVERSQSSKVGKAKLYQPDQPPKAEGSAPVTAAVTELLGVDREGFLISVFARQFELDRLRSMDPTPRMQTVLRLLGINQITKAVKIVREEANEQKKSLDTLRATQIDATAIKDQIEELSLDREVYATQAVTARDSLSTARQHKELIEQARIELEPQRQAHRAYLNDLQAAQAALNLAERRFNEDFFVEGPKLFPPKEPEYKPVDSISEEEIERLRADYMVQRDLYTEHKSNLERIQNQLDTMQDVCPTCKRPFDGVVHRERERARMQDEIKHILLRMEEVSRVGNGAHLDWTDAAKRKQEAEAINQQNASLEADFKMAMHRYEQSVQRQSEARQRHGRAEIALLAAQDELKALVLNPVEAVDDESLLQDLDDTNAEIARLSSLQATADANLANLDKDLARLNTQLEEGSRSVKEAKKLESQVVEKETTAQELQRLKEQMIGGIIPALNERASVLIEQMTDGKYTELSLTPEYEIEYRNSQGDLKNFLNLSGGEQTVFALALRLAISDLRAGNLGVLFLDEAISSLSSEDGRQESVWSAIESLTSRFRQIFVITHVDAFKDRAPFSVRL